MTIPCLTCRYDLTATPRTGVCPECGAEAEESHRAAAEAARHSPRLAAILAQAIAFGTSAATAVTVTRHVTIDSVGTLLLFCAFLVAVVAPPIGVGIVAWLSRAHRAASIATLVASVLLAIAHTFVLIQVFVVANDPLALLGLLALPLIGVPVLVGAAIAACVILRPRP